MRPDDHCDLCSLTLEAACQSEGGEFCALKEEYLTTDMGADDMYERLVEITSGPEQLERIQQTMNRLASVGWRPPTRSSVQAQDPGEAAAQRWLEGYRNGRGDGRSDDG
jgi:hypothetical protein